MLWETRNGEKFKIERMSYNHLIYSLSLIIRRNRSPSLLYRGPWRVEFIRPIIKEIVCREAYHVFNGNTPNYSPDYDHASTIAANLAQKINLHEIPSRVNILLQRELAKAFK